MHLCKLFLSSYTTGKVSLPLTLASELLLQWDTHMPTHISASAGVQLFHHYIQDLLQDHKHTAQVSNMLGACSEWINHATRLQGHLPKGSRLSRSYPYGLKPVPGKEEEPLWSLQSWDLGQGLLRATRGLAHESTSAGLCTASLPLPLVPSSQKAPC